MKIGSGCIAWWFAFIGLLSLSVPVAKNKE
jgi:hypothetical protein